MGQWRHDRAVSGLVRGVESVQTWIGERVSTMKELCSEILDAGPGWKPCHRPAKFAITYAGRTFCRCGYHARKYRNGEIPASDIRPLGKSEKQT